MDRPDVTGGSVPDWPAPRHPHLAATPWPAEDGGPRRQQVAHGLGGPAASAGRLAAVRQAPLTVMVLLAPGGRVLVLRATIGPDAASWVEEVDPRTLVELGRSPDLPLGPFWPGGAAVLADGGVLVVQGRWAHRLAPDLSVVAARELPVDAPHNSFVLLGDGTVATKDLQRPDGPASTLRLLDPDTLADRGAPVALPEPSVARLSAADDDLVVVGTSAVHRLRWDGAAGVLAPVADPARYLVHEGQSFGWDPVLAAGATWFLDNGDHTFERSLSMLGNGVATGPVRLWRLDDATGALTSVEVSGQASGAVTNPPLVDEGRGLALAYDSANGTLAAFATDDLALVWRRPCNTGQHLRLHPDTGEVVADDHDPALGDVLVVLDVATGAERVRVPVESPAQSVVFGAPAWDGAAYYASLSTLARVEWEPGPAR